MKKFLLSLLVLLTASVFMAKAQIMEPIFLEEWEYTTEGYRILPDIVKDVEAATGIVNFGRVKGFAIQNALSFTGEGERSEFTDGFMFEFVPKDGKKYGHNTFEAYAKALWDQCLKAADDGKLVDGFGENSKSITFEESIRVVDKKQDRKKSQWYYIYKGDRRKMEVIERRYSETGFGELYVHMQHN